MRRREVLPPTLLALADGSSDKGYLLRCMSPQVALSRQAAAWIETTRPPRHSARRADNASCARRRGDRV